MIWTTTRPEKPGWYWYRKDGLLSCWKIRIGDGKRTELWAYQPHRIDDGHGLQLLYFKGGEWQGPIEPEEGA